MTAQQRRKRRMIRRFAPTVALCAVIANHCGGLCLRAGAPGRADTQPEAASTETVAAATKIAPAITKAAEQINAKRRKRSRRKHRKKQSRKNSRRKRRKKSAVMRR